MDIFEALVIRPKSEVFARDVLANRLVNKQVKPKMSSCWKTRTICEAINRMGLK